MKHFAYRIRPERADSSIGMVSIPDDSMMHRVPEGAVEVTASPMPEDKSGTYFEAWRISDDGEVIVDLEAAKEVRLTALRKRRDDLFRNLDSLQFRAFCSGDDTARDRIEEEKNRLRDFTDRIDWDVVKTVSDLNHVLPPELV